MKGAIVTEGEIDAMTFHEVGLYNVASVPNGAGAGKVNLEYLDNCYDSFAGIKKVILATDGDHVGDQLRYELARRLGLDRCFKIQYPDEKVIKDSKTGQLRACKDPNEVLCHFGAEAVKSLYENAKEWPIEGILTCEDMVDDIVRFWEQGFPIGEAAGIEGLDELIKFQDGQFTTITGIPGSGKSEFLDYILAMMAKRHGHKSAVISFENQPSALHVTKLMQKVAGRSFAHRYNPAHRMTQTEFNSSLVTVNDHFFFLNLNDLDITIDSAIEKLKEPQHPTEFCVKVTDENRDVLTKVWNEFYKGHTITLFEGIGYMHSNSIFTFIDPHSSAKTSKIVTTEEFLKYIGREDLIERKNVEIDFLNDIQTFLKGKSIILEIDEIQELEKIFLKYHS